MSFVLAKQALDVGLYVSDADASLGFWRDRLELAYDHLLPVGGGVRQHRLDLLGSVLKLNESRAALPTAATGYRRLLLAGDRWQGNDPDGVGVERGAPGVTATGVMVATADPETQGRCYTDGLGAEAVDERTYRIGTTVLRLVEDPAVERSGPLQAIGFRYLTVQVTDVVAAHAHAVAGGLEDAMSPRRLGDVAAIAFVRDPGGNWIELSQRASLTGPLPDLAAPST